MSALGCASNNEDMLTSGNKYEGVWCAVVRIRMCRNDRMWCGMIKVVEW